MRYRRVLLVAVVAICTFASIGVNAYAGGSHQTGNFTEAAQATARDASAVVETPPQPTTDHNCGDTGEKQQEVEENLDELGGYGPLFVDGEQSQEDCDAITKFQKRMGIQPAEGYAGEVTHSVLKRLVASDLDDCKADEGRQVCIDMTHQTLWVVDDGEIVLGPTAVRTGMAGYQTQPGVHTIKNKSPKEWSKPYKVWLPQWQRFYGGQGLHQTTTYLHNMGPGAGSHGCVNLLPNDAAKLYEMLDVGDTIHLFGQRPGT